MAEHRGRYVYGIAEGRDPVQLGRIGIDGNEVYAIPFQGLCAIVHACDAAPYQSNDPKLVENWVISHQNALDQARKQFNTIIPLSFDAILQSRDGSIHADEVVKNWLKEDYDRLLALIEKIRGADEYVVQVLYQPEKIVAPLVEADREIKQLAREAAAKSPGAAYLYRQKLDKAAKTRIEELADTWFRSFYTRIKRHCKEIIVEKTRKSDGEVMLINLSCLVVKDKVEGLGVELDEINSLEGFSVHFSGPWPPYSFVSGSVRLAQEANR